MIELELPWPPSVNHYYRHVGNRVLISKPGRTYRQTVVAMLRPRFRAPLMGRLGVSIRAFPPDRRRRDLDNLQKCLLDSLQHARVYGDDSQIDSLSIVRCDPVPKGLLRVAIEEGVQCN